MRKVSMDKYIAIFLTTLLAFIAGIFISQKISEYTSRDLTKTQNELKNYLLGLDLQLKIASEYICKVDIFKITKEKAEIGEKIDILEKNMGKESQTVKELKKEYFLLSIRQWLLIKQFKDECNPKINIVLFFYSNKNNQTESEAQGYILDYLYEKNPQNLIIYALDIDERDPALDTIKAIYGINQAPSIVVNEKVFSGLQEKETIERHLIR